MVSGEARKAKPRSRVRVETYDLRLHDVQLKIESHEEAIADSVESVYMYVSRHIVILSWIKEILVQETLKETFSKEQQMY